MVCTCTRSFVRANAAKIVHSRDVQCNIEESPKEVFIGKLTRAAVI